MRAEVSGGWSWRASVGRSSTPSARPRPKPAFAKVDDFNCGNNEGCGYFHVNQRTGVRWNTSKAFLRPVKHRRNLSIETEALVERLTLEGKRVTGLVLRQGGARRTLRARREVILCAGAIGSPQILQLSGIAAGTLLRHIGIPVQHELKGVGENLQDHLQIRCAYKVEGAPTMNERFGSLLRRAGFAAQYALTRRGPMTMAPSQLGAFVKSDPSRDTPNLQYHVQPLTLPKFGEPLDPFPAFTASVANIRPTSRGWVRITAADPDKHPEIRPNYLSTEEDRQVAAASVRVTRQIVSMPALAKYRPQEFRPGLEFESDAALAQAAGDISTTIFHPVGTAKMGNDDTAVVDHRLQGARPCGLAGRRCLGDADHHVGQHQCTDADDCREGGGDDPRGGRRGCGGQAHGIVMSRRAPRRGMLGTALPGPESWPASGPPWRPTLGGPRPGSLRPRA